MGDPYVTGGYLVSYGLLALYAVSLIVRSRRSTAKSDED